MLSSCDRRPLLGAMKDAQHFDGVGCRKAIDDNIGRPRHDLFARPDMSSAPSRLRIVGQTIDAGLKAVALVQRGARAVPRDIGDDRVAIRHGARQPDNSHAEIFFSPICRNSASRRVRQPDATSALSIQDASAASASSMAFFTSPRNHLSCSTAM